MSNIILKIVDLEASAFGKPILQKVNLMAEEKKILTIIGPRGSGKSSLLRCVNRLYEERAGHKVSGQIFFRDHNIYDFSWDIFELRRKVGMIFSEPVLFEHLSIFENIALGLRLKKIESGAEIGASVEKALTQLDIWNSIKDSLHKSPSKLNPGVKQMICLARVLVLKPEIILMDEPTTAIGLQNTFHFEQFLKETSKKITIIMTTSSRKQAARISDRTAFLLNGELIEVGKTSDLFMNPKDHRTEDFLTGRFG